MTKSESIGVLGLGNWGTALSNHLASRGHDVLGWCIEKEIPPGINSTHRNPLYQSAVELHPGFKATNDLGSVTERPILVLVLPSHIVGKVIPTLNLKSPKLMVSAVKGLDSQSFETTLQLAERLLPKGIELATLSGPSFARDVVRGQPCGVVAASKSESSARKVAEIFSGGAMRVYTSNDPLGVEIGALVKNVIALAAGVCDGLNLGDSARAGLITRGLAEMTRLAVKMGADARTLSGLSGLGDLVMTASCDTSRNRTVGLRLGRGEKLDDILRTLGSVAEAIHTAPLVLKLAEKYQVEMPISVEVGKIIRAEINPQEMVANLMSRPIRSEVG